MHPFHIVTPDTGSAVASSVALNSVPQVIAMAAIAEMSRCRAEVRAGVSAMLPVWLVLL